MSGRGPQALHKSPEGSLDDLEADWPAPPESADNSSRSCEIDVGAEGPTRPLPARDVAQWNSKF